MKIFLGLLLIASCLAVSNATIKILKSKLSPPPLIYPARYQTVKYLASPVVIRDPLPATYARPAVQFSTHLTTYKVSAPSIVTYSAPVQTYSAPAVFAHDVSPALYYSGPVTAYAEPFSTHVVEEHYYDDRKR